MTLDDDISSIESLIEMVAKLFDLWGLTETDKAELLDLEANSVTESSIRNKLQTGNKDLEERISSLLTIHKLLKINYPHNNEIVHAWVTATNMKLSGQTPLKIMSAQGLDGYQIVKNLLNQDSKSLGLS